MIPSSFTLQYQLAGQLGFLRSKAVEVCAATQADQRGTDATVSVGAVLYPFELRNQTAPWQDIKALFRLLRIVGKTKPHLIQSCTKKGGLLSGIVGRLTGTPVVYVVFGLIGEKASASREWLFCLIEKIICTLVDRVVVISRSNMQLFQAGGICPTRKLLLFGAGSGAGVDADRFIRTGMLDLQASTLRKRLGIAQAAQVLGFVGRIVIEKGIRELFAAWEKLRECFPEIHLLFVSPPEVDPRLATTISQLQADPRVHFTGFIVDPRPAYAAMDCLVLPSYSEGFPNVLLEAGAMEIPVIATRVSGCVDAVVHGITGLLIEPRNATALADAIEWVLLHPHVTREWGRKARARCIADFRPQAIWQAYLDLYQLLVADRESTPPDVPERDADSHRDKPQVA